MLGDLLLLTPKEFWASIWRTIANGDNRPEPLDSFPLTLSAFWLAESFERSLLRSFLPRCLSSKLNESIELVSESSEYLLKALMGARFFLKGDLNPSSPFFPSLLSLSSSLNFLIERMSSVLFAVILNFDKLDLLRPYEGRNC